MGDVVVLAGSAEARKKMNWLFLIFFLSMAGALGGLTVLSMFLNTYTENQSKLHWSEATFTVSDVTVYQDQCTCRQRRCDVCWFLEGIVTFTPEGSNSPISFEGKESTKSDDMAAKWKRNEAQPLWYNPEAVGDVVFLDPKSESSSSLTYVILGAVALAIFLPLMLVALRFYLRAKGRYKAALDAERAEAALTQAQQQQQPYVAQVVQTPCDVQIPKSETDGQECAHNPFIAPVAAGGTYRADPIPQTLQGGTYRADPIPQTLQVQEYHELGQQSSLSSASHTNAAASHTTSPSIL